ncbi:MAG: hypothetical protein AABZ39_03760 [Spirochaetota bacterium]
MFIHQKIHLHRRCIPIIALAVLTTVSCIPSRDYLMENAPQISVASFVIRSVAGTAMTADLMLSINNRYDVEVPLTTLTADVSDGSGALLVSANVTTNTFIGALSTTLIPVSALLDMSRIANATASAVSQGKMLLTVRGSALIGKGKRAQALPFEHTITVIIPRVGISKLGIGEINPIAGRVNLAARLTVENDPAAGTLVAITYTCTLNGTLISSASLSNVSPKEERSEFDLSLPVYMRVATDAFSAVVSRKSVAYVIDAVFIYRTAEGEQAVPYRFAGSLGGK